jgi:hypothetical protein
MRKDKEDMGERSTRKERKSACTRAKGEKGKSKRPYEHGKKIFIMDI